MPLLEIPAPDGAVSVLLEQWLVDAGDDSRVPCNSQKHVEDHTEMSTHIAWVTPSRLNLDTPLCDGCAAALLGGDGDILFGL